MSKKITVQRMDSNVALENIEVEECMESKVHRISTAASKENV